MSTAVTTEQVEQVVVESLQTFGADPEQITPDATFEALDIDSLDLAELSQIVHEQFGVELKGSDVAEVKTVEDAVNADRLAAVEVEPIVVTGVGAVTPLGVGARALHERWCAGACGISDGEAPCAEFDPKDFLSAKEARRADRFTQLALAACAEALADAGWEDGRERRAPIRPRACRLRARHGHRWHIDARGRPGHACASVAASTSRRWRCR